MARYTYERIKPLNEASDIETHLTALYNLTELALASKILLGAQYKTKGMMRFCRLFEITFLALYTLKLVCVFSILYTFAKVLRRRILLAIKYFLVCDHFFYSSDHNV